MNWPGLIAVAIVTAIGVSLIVWLLLKAKYEREEEDRENAADDDRT